MRAVGEGTVCRRSDGRWVAAIHLEEDGTVRRKYLYASTQQAVLKKLSEARDKVAKGLPLPDARVSLGGYLDYWLEARVRPRVRPRSFNSYEGPIRLYIKPRLGKKRLVKLTAED